MKVVKTSQKTVGKWPKIPWSKELRKKGEGGRRDRQMKDVAEDGDVKLLFSPVPDSQA